VRSVRAKGSGIRFRDSSADAYSDGTTIFPQSVLFFLKANDGNYTANVAYTRLSYRW